jgi:chromosome segregation ATPase
MPDDAQHQRLNGLEERQHTLLTKLARLQADHDLETRAQEKLRLEHGIAETQVTLQQVETELLSIKQQALLSEANRLKRIGSIREAIGIWREILRNDTASNIAAQEIAVLEQLDSLQTQTSDLIKRLASRVKDIRNIFKEVVAALKQPANTAEYMMLVEQAELLLDDVLDAETFIIWWEAVTAAPSQPTPQNVDIPVVNENSVKLHYPHPQ